MLDDQSGLLFSKDGTRLIDFARKNTSYRIYTVPQNVKEIDAFAFYGCDAMKTLTLQEGLETIGAWAFTNCSIMPSLTLPTTVKSIGTNAFYGMTGCKKFTCQTVEPLALDSLLNPFGMFTDLSAKTLYVPTPQAVELYKAAPVWKDFGDIKFYKGDVNADDAVNVSDVSALINKILGTEDWTDTVCDIDGNGIVNVTDVSILISYLLY